MISILLYMSLFLLFGRFNCQDGNSTLRYEYKYSFKGPALSQTDGTIPFWNHTGDAVPGDEQVRIVPSLRAKTGAVWSNYPFPYDDWQLDVHFRIQGRGKLGADGLVVWLVETPAQIGPVFGYMDMWKGVGIFFDSFDNDNQHNNPYVSAIMNDGSLSYNHATDGFEQKAGGCLRDFRNRPYPVKVRVTYTGQTLTVLVDSGATSVEEFEVCLKVEGVVIPKNYYFGVTAATGGLADDHDVLKFMVWSRHVGGNVSATEVESESNEEKEREEERRRLEEEYERNLQEFQKKQEEYLEQHPEQAKQQGSVDDLFEGGSSKELKAVFEVQEQIKKQINHLVTVLSTVQGKQDFIVSKLDGIGTTGGQDGVDVAKSHQVDNLMNFQRQIYDKIESLNNQLNFIKTTSVSLSDSVTRMAAERPVGGTYESKQDMNDLKDRLEMLQSNIVSLQSKVSTPPRLSCPQPDPPSCVSIGLVLLVAIAQVAVIIIYHSVKQSREDAAKKFF
ncbi:protein ERGIC-53-like [Ciona intestinalis]